MKKLLGKVIRKIGRVLNSDVRENMATKHQAQEVLQQVRGLGKHADQQSALLKKFDQPSIAKVEQIERALKKAEAYQPLYGIEGLHIGGNDVARPNSRERARAVAHGFGEDIHGMRLIDVGSSLGYVSFYLADRGAKVEGWDFRSENTEVSRLVHEINRVDNVDFKTREMTLDIIRGIQPGRYDGVVILSVLHHTVMYRGLEYTQNLMKELLERVPTVIVELAQKGEDPKLKWDKTLPKKDVEIFDKAKKLGIKIEKLGEFETHLSGVKRPLYKVSRDHVTVDNKNYPIDRASRVAYEGSKVRSPRVFHKGSDVFVKEYALGRNTKDTNKVQLINEINFYLQTQDKEIPNIPKLLGYEIKGTSAYIVLNKVDGSLIDQANAIDFDVDIKRVIKELIVSLAALEQQGYYHNDLRSWNVLFTPKDVTLIDFGMAAPIETEDNRIALLWVMNAILTKTREGTEPNKKDLPPRENFTNDYALKIYDVIEDNEDITFRELSNL